MASSNTCISWDNFYQIHHQQLQSIGLPEHLWKALYNKLAPKVIHDVGSRFERRKMDEMFEKKWTLHSKESLKKYEDVFLVDHAWTSDGGIKAKEVLFKKPELRKRMQDILCLSDTSSLEEGEYLDQEDVVAQLGKVDAETAKECLEKSKYDLIHALIHAETGDQRRTPEMNVEKTEKENLLDYEDFKYGFTASLDEESKKAVSEEFIQKMHRKYLKDHEEVTTGREILYGKGTTVTYSWSESEDDDGVITVLISVSSDAKKSSILNKITPSKWTLGVKGCEPVIDGEFYGKVMPDECFWMFDGPGVIQMTLQKADPDDRLWPVLIKGENQLSPCQIFDELKTKEQLEKEPIDNILNDMWYLNQTYQAVLVKGGPQEHIWYIMDEYGSALTHSNTPNIKCSPFAYAVNGVIYSLIWPVMDIDKGAVCTRNFCPSLNMIETPLHLKARQLACMPVMPDTYPSSFLQDFAATFSTAKYACQEITTTPLLPDSKDDQHSDLKLPLKFFVEEKYKDVRSVLSNLGCSFVEKPEEAEALWLGSQAVNLTSSQKVNVLSGDEFLVRRDVLSRIIHTKCGEVPWFPVSFNLRSQLPAFCVEHYLRSLSAMWVLRSANPSESHFRPVISSNLRKIIRLGETGPLVASQFYISVALSNHKHFCLQYSVIVPSLKPLTLLVHDTPHIRRTPKKFDPMEELDEYDPSSLITTSDVSPQDAETMEEFLKGFEKNYLKRKEQTWNEVKKKIYNNIYELFLVVSSSLSQPGKVNSVSEGPGRLFAVYGVDILILEDMSAVVIGVDAVPSFANNQVAKEVLYLAYNDQELVPSLGSRFTKVTSSDTPDTNICS